MDLTRMLRQRKQAYVGVGVTQPSCEDGGTEATRNIRLGYLPALVFACTFAAYIFLGIVCVLTPPAATNAVADVPISDTAVCWRAARHSDYVSVEIGVGSPGRRLKVLMRWDRVVEAPTSPLRLFSERVMESRTMQCVGVNTSCNDAILGNRGGPNTGFSRLVAEFDYTNPTIERSTYSVAGYQLRLDGEMYMMAGYKYWLTSTHVCFDQSADDPPSSTSGALRATITSGYVVAQSTALAHVSVDILGSSYAREATVNFLCDNTTLGSVGTVEILPVAASTEQAYLALSDQKLYESEPSEVSTRRKLVELGTACVQALPWYSREYNLYLLDCNNALATCRPSASLPFRRISTLDFYAHYGTSGTVVYHFEKSPTLATLPGLQSTADAVALSIVKLVLVLMAAALVWMRSDRVTSKPHWLYRHCIQAAHCVRIPNADVSSVVEDATLGLAAVISRFAVAMWRIDTLQYDSQSRVCIFELVASAASFVHWIARYWMIDPWLPDIVNGKSDGRGPLTRLGGSSAVVDTNCAVLLAFSEPPMLISAVGRFDPTARLLIGILISMVSLPRCLFSVACCSILWEAGALGKARIEMGFSIMLLLSIGFWVLQIMALSIAVNDLVVIPLGFSIARGIVGDATWATIALSLGLVTSGTPRLLNSCVRLSARH